MRQKKVIWIVVGVAIVAGIGYWLYKKRKEKATKTTETVTEETVPTPAKQATSQAIEVVRIIAPVVERTKPSLGTTSGSAVGTEYRASVVPVGGQMMLVVPTRSGGRYVISEVG